VLCRSSSTRASRDSARPRATATICSNARSADGGPGSKAVLEVRSHDVPFVLEHGQAVGWLRYERLAGTPDRLYGAGIGSSYQGQGLKLGKQFRPWR